MYQTLPSNLSEVIRVDGTRYQISPRDGRYFQLDELREIVKGYLEIVPTLDHRLMVVNEEGKILDPPLPLNLAASFLYINGYADPIHGDVLVAPRHFFEVS